MNKVYIQVYELLRDYGVPFDELLQLVKSGKLALYHMTKLFEYEAIANFDCYVDDWIARKRETLEKQYINKITNISYPNERIARFNSIHRSILERYQGQRVIRELGIDEIITRGHNKKIKRLADREGVARELAARLFVKANDYESMANNVKLAKQNKKQDTEIRKKKTQEVCQSVEKLYGENLINKSKNDVLELVKAEMNYKVPYMEVFNNWFRDCKFTRGAGNPNFTKKSVYTSLKSILTHF